MQLADINLVHSYHNFHLYRVVNGLYSAYYETTMSVDCALSRDGVSALIRGGGFKEARDNLGKLVRIAKDKEVLGLFVNFHRVRNEAELAAAWYPSNGRKAATYDVNKTVMRGDGL